ncbi:hypothetical protein GF359_04060, partial [candidate division WOR-3 bacterium]|nr:hypothetical protein [candidate division WOR-3 bacterium]MBD3364372.1 hypothetical protein [candidate division WOR-3 bacterium]
MSAIFLWLRKGTSPDKKKLQKSQVFFSHIGREKSKIFEGSWTGTITVWGKSSLVQNTGSTVYFAQSATGISADITFTDPFNKNSLNQYEGIWILIEVLPQNSTIKLAQDRLGGFPLYVYKDNRNFILSSGIKSIREVIPDKCNVNLELLAGNLLTSWKPHFDDGTLFTGIKKLVPGKVHLFNLHRNVYKSTKYAKKIGYQPLWKFPTKQNIDEASTILRSELNTSVKNNISEISEKIALPLSGG